MEAVGACLGVGDGPAQCSKPRGMNELPLRDVVKLDIGEVMCHGRVGCMD